MSTENREEILADFQACTGIEDVSEAIYHLEQSNWNLVNAVSRAVPIESQLIHSTPNNRTHRRRIQDDDNDEDGSGDGDDNDNDNDDDDDDVIIVKESSTVGSSSTITKNHNEQPSTSTSASTSSTHIDRYNFKIQYEDRVVRVDFPSTATIRDLKAYLQKHLQIPQCRQVLSSWARMTTYENTPFDKLMIPRENVLHLTVKADDSIGFTADNDAVIAERMSGTYILNIDTPKIQRPFQYNGTCTIQKVKNDLSDVTGIQVRNQVWTGWPVNINTDTMLALSGINYPEHNLILRENQTSNQDKGLRANRTLPSEVVEIDSDDDEFEDASESFNIDDDYFTDNLCSNRRPEPLIPDNVEDEIVGSISFAEQFTNRYGALHPMFYQSTLDDAVKEACNKPAADRKILAIYLHHDRSVLTNVFCTHLLGYESVMQIISTYFLLWGWDLTYESNRTRLQTALQTALGPLAALTVRNMLVERLPALLLIIRRRSSTDIFNVIHGDVGIDELVSSLMEAVDDFRQHQTVEIAEEQARAERELVKWEQDRAFHESLAADKAKDEARIAQAVAATEARRRKENERAEEMEKREKRRQHLQTTLPNEPSVDRLNLTTKLRFRLPNGQYLERRFALKDTLNVLLNFLIVHGYPYEEFKVISSWPRRDLTALDFTQSLEELKFCPQETVILEER